MLTTYQIRMKKDEETAYLEKLQKNRKKASKAKKAYWQARIDDFFLNGIIK